MEAGSACLPLVGECAYAADGYFRNLAAGGTASASEAAAAGPSARVGAAKRAGKGAGETLATETAKAERLLEAARGLLAGLGPLQRAVDQCTWYAAASQDRRISHPLESAIREVQRRTLELVRTLEHADAAYVQLLAVDAAAAKASAGRGAIKTESAGGLPLPPVAPSASQSSTRWETQSDHLVEASAAVTTAHRILLRELRPQLSMLARHIDTRGLRSILLNVHGAAGEFGVAWTALTAVLLDAPTENHGGTVAEPTAPAGAVQSADLDNWVLPGAGQPNGAGHPAHQPQAREPAPATSVRTAVPPGFDVTVASRASPVQPAPQPGSASVNTAPQPPPTVRAPQQLARQWSVPYPDSRLCTTAEVAAAVAESVLRLLDDSLAMHNEETPEDLRDFARQVPVVRQAIGRLVSALKVYGDPSSAANPAVVTGSIEKCERATSGRRLLDEAETFVKSIIQLSSLAKHVTMEQKDQLSRAAVSGICMLTRSTKGLALALQDLSRPTSTSSFASSSLSQTATASASASPPLSVPRSQLSSSGAVPH